MKKALFIGLLAVATLSACAKKYTCPTYSKANGTEKPHTDEPKTEKGNN